ncbi:MAG: PQQ-binding-like beta-propeller repeat protein [Bacteroidales bacterium]|nr:PQQ-binding-like beta-propeller repeat protein [Bacteroidales bacterium]
MWNDHIYLTASIEEAGELQILCIDRSTGNQVWRSSLFPQKFENPHPVGDLAPATIAADASGIYVYFASDGLRCLDHDGNLKWEFPIPVPESANYGSPNSPVIMDDKIILNLDYGDVNRRSLLALDKATGTTVWKTLTQEVTPFINYGYPGYSTPVRYHDQVILHRCGGIAAYRLSDGSPVWWFQIMTNGIGTPIINNDIIYITAWMELSEAERRGAFFSYDTFEKVLADMDKNGNGLMELDEIPEDMMVFSRPGVDDIEGTQFSVRKFFRNDKDGSVNEEEWIQKFNYLNAVVDDFGMMAIPAEKKGELSSDDILWMQMEKNPEVPSPVAFGDCILMVSDGGWVTCMDAETGIVHLQERIGAPGAYIASPVSADGKIYLASYSGKITVLKEGKQPAVISMNPLDGKILATPAISGNNLYVRTSKHLYAFKN